MAINYKINDGAYRTFLNAVTLAAKQISATILEEKKHNSGKTNY
jgi:hypothetical protein